MNAAELLHQIHRHTTEAKVLVDALTAAVARGPVLATECRECVDELNLCLREASRAATALRSLAAGNEPPKQG